MPALINHKKSPSTIEHYASLPRGGTIANLPARDFEPLTLISKDGCGSDIQLLRFKKKHLLGAVLSPEKDLRFVDGRRIKNAIRPSDKPEEIVKALLGKDIKEWDIALNDLNGTYNIWPKLQAAGSKNRDNFVVAKAVNPFANCSVEDCERILKEHGFSRRYIAPNNSQSWIKVVDGEIFRKAYIDLGQDNPSGPGTGYSEPPHIDIQYNISRKSQVPILDGQGNLKRDAQGEIISRPREVKKRKFPLNPGDSRWESMITKCTESSRLTELLRGRSGDASNLRPTLMKGGTEVYVSTLKDLTLQDNYVLLVPRLLGAEQILPDEVNRMIRELFVGWIINKEVPSVSMDSNADHSIDLALPASYQGTLVGEVYKEMDAVGKAVMMGIQFPPQARVELYQTLEILKGDRPDLGFLKDYTNDNIVKLYRDHGVEPLDRDFLAALRRHEAALEKIHLAHGPSSGIFTFTCHIERIWEHDGYLQTEVAFHVTGTMKFETPVSDEAQKKADETMAAYAKLIRERLLASARYEKTIALFKLSTVCLSLMHSLHEEYGILPHLADMPAVPIMYLHEDKMPPYIRGDATEECMRPIHGAAHSVPSEVAVKRMSGLDVQIVQDEQADLTKPLRLAQGEYIRHPLPYAHYAAGSEGPTWFHEMVGAARKRQSKADKEEKNQRKHERKMELERCIPRLDALISCDVEFYHFVEDACYQDSLKMYLACKALWLKRSTTSYTARRSWKSLLNEPLSKTVNLPFKLHPSRSWLNPTSYQSAESLPLAIAAGHGSRALLEALLADGADANPSEWTAAGLLKWPMTYPLERALWSGSQDNVRLLRSYGATEENPFVFFNAHGEYIYLTGDKTYLPNMRRHMGPLIDQKFKEEGGEGNGHNILLWRAAAYSLEPTILKQLIEKGLKFDDAEAAQCLYIWFEADLQDQQRAELIKSMGQAFLRRHGRKISAFSWRRPSWAPAAYKAEFRGDHHTVQALQAYCDPYG